MAAASGATARGLLQEGFRAALGSWAVLQIAVDNGFGGAYSQEKAEWMVDALEQYFYTNADLEQYEVEEFLSELMNNEFDTLVEDGSLPEVAQQVCTFYRQCQQGEVDAVRKRIAQLCQKKQQVKVSAVQAQMPDQDDSDSEEEEEEEAAHEQAMDCEAPPAVPYEATSSVPPSGTPEVLDRSDTSASGMDEEVVALDGWTVVRKKKK